MPFKMVWHVCNKTYNPVLVRSDLLQVEYCKKAIGWSWSIEEMRNVIFIITMDDIFLIEINNKTVK